MKNKTAQHSKDALKKQHGFVLPTALVFLLLILLLAPVALQVSSFTYSTSQRQIHTQQAQLASTAGLEFAKEQYEIDVDYQNTPETDLANDSKQRITYEIQHIEYLNVVHTQQKILAIGRVYLHGEAQPSAEQKIIGTLTRQSGSGASSRFIFIVDNSGSMSVSEWNDSKETVDIAIEYVLANVPDAGVAVVQYGTNTYSEEHKYDVTVPFTSDSITATNWDRRYGHGTSAIYDYQDHMAASLARMRHEGVYGPGAPLDLIGATSVQYVVFTDAWGMDFSGCCSALKHYSGSTFDTTNGGTFTTLDQHGEFNALKDGSVYVSHGYSGITAQFTVLNINQDTSRETIETSAAIASPGGSWTGAIDENPGDPEGEGILPRRYISTSLLQTDPNDILEIIDEIIQAEINI